ncbi:MAG: Imm1 family immunity protein [Planctomycetales bacterium]
MIARFFDRQDTANPLNGVTVPDERTLDEALDSLRKREPSFCELMGDNGFELLIGVGHDIGCVQYSAADGSLPYLIAVASESANDDGYVEFLTADTPTPIPVRYCLPLRMIRAIAAEFVITGERSESVTWEEVS